MRIGHGYDAHRFADGRRLVLCGAEIKYGKGMEAHSDGDVPLHALMDAMLGAAAMHDIGYHFPPSDEKYKNISSLVLLGKTARIVAQSGYRLVNADITIIAEEPKLSPYIDVMRQNIAHALCCDVGCISVKATTEEHMGFTGSLEGIAAHAVVLLDGADGKTALL